MGKGEKLTKKKKLIISLSVVLGVIIILGTVILGLFCPRKLAGYIDLKPEDVDEIYISYHVPNKENQIVYLDKNKKDLFFYCLEHTKVIPEYLHYKVTEPYNLYIISGKQTYRFNGLRMNLYENGEVVKSKNYYIYSGKMRYFIYLYNIPEEDLEYI